MKRWIIMGLLAGGMLTIGCNKNQLPQQQVQTATVVDAQQYIFRAQTANPAGGTSITLTSAYDVVVRPDAVVAHLPYFGRVYTPTDISGGGIRFTSRQFRYSNTNNGKDGWEITITPQDVPDIRELRLSIGPDGYATLLVLSNSRQSISFYGKVQQTTK